MPIREYQCCRCGATFRRYASEVARNHRNYCSQRCNKLDQVRPIEERFWEKVEKGDGCWLWTGARRRNDQWQYGVLKRGGPQGQAPVRAHRFSWELHNGPVPEGLFVLHHCDNPRCVRPDHLFVGTPQDNMSDMIAKGRLRRRGPDTKTRPHRKLRSA